MRLESSGFHLVCDPARTVTPGELAGKRLHAVAGIGNPQRFFDHLSRLGLRFVPHVFPDHHRYVAPELAFVDADALLMTEKDAVKCAGFAPPDAWVLRVDAQVSPAAPSAAGPNGLLELVLEKLDGRTPA
jgi:tetraacyldisaccharide 4'-kinase